MRADAEVRITAAQRRAAGKVMASVALDIPGDTWVAEHALRDVLEALGIKVARRHPSRIRDGLGRNLRPPTKTEREALTTLTTLESADKLGPRAGCRESAGTERGYNRHLSIYETPCDACLVWRERSLAERWEGLGLTHGTHVTLPE